MIPETIGPFQMQARPNEPGLRATEPQRLAQEVLLIYRQPLKLDSEYENCQRKLFQLKRYQDAIAVGPNVYGEGTAQQVNAAIALAQMRCTEWEQTDLGAIKSKVSELALGTIRTKEDLIEAEMFLAKMDMERPKLMGEWARSTDTQTEILRQKIAQYKAEHPEEVTKTVATTFAPVISPSPVVAPVLPVIPQANNGKQGIILPAIIGGLGAIVLALGLSKK